MTSPFRVVAADEVATAEIVRLRPALHQRPARIALDLDDHRDTANVLGMVTAVLVEATGLKDDEVAACMAPVVTAAVVRRWRAGLCGPSARDLLVLIALAGPVGLRTVGDLEFAEGMATGGGCRG